MIMKVLSPSRLEQSSLFIQLGMLLPLLLAPTSESLISSENVPLSLRKKSSFAKYCKQKLYVCTTKLLSALVYMQSFNQRHPLMDVCRSGSVHQLIHHHPSPTNGNSSASAIITHCLAFSPCGRFLSSGGSDKLVRVWQLPNWILRKTVYVSSRRRTRLFWLDSILIIYHIV
jgi:WD40 repeat protein